MKKHIIIFTIATTLLLSGCEDPQDGALTGALFGSGIGASLGDSTSDSIAGAIVGGALGAVFGDTIGTANASAIDADEQHHINREIRRAMREGLRTGGRNTQRWIGKHARGKITFLPESYHHGRSCRKYISKIRYLRRGKHTVSITEGRACRKRSGIYTYKIINNY